MNTEQRYLLGLPVQDGQGWSQQLRVSWPINNVSSLSSHSLMIFKPIAFFVAPNCLNLSRA